MTRSTHLLQLGAYKARRLIARLLPVCMLALALLPAAALASPLPDQQPYVVAVPPRGTLQVAVSGHCLDYGLPFPGSTLQPASLADPAIRLAIRHGLEQGYTSSESLAQLQSAIWSLAGDVDISGDDMALARDIVSFATSGAQPHDLDETAGTSLVSAVQQGLVSAQLIDFVNVSTPPYFGKGTLVVSNLSETTQVLSLPYGTVFEDATQPGVQDMAVFPSALPEAGAASGAQRESVCNQLAVRLPAQGSTKVLINGHCLDYGLPFPGASIRTLQLSPDIIRNTICYNLSQGTYESDLWQAQLAVWHQTDDLDMGDKFALVNTIAAYAESDVEPGDLSDDCTALPTAVEQGLVSAEIDDFVDIADPGDYFGQGTLSLVNLTSSDQTICIPFGTTFRDETQSGVQDMGVFPSMRPDPAAVAAQVVPGAGSDPAEPQVLPQTGGSRPSTAPWVPAVLLVGLAAVMGGLVLRWRLR